MTGKEFLKAVANGETDLLQAFLDVLQEAGAEHCVIGGLAVRRTRRSSRAFPRLSGTGSSER